MADTVALDTNVLDWLLEAGNLSAMLELRRKGILGPVVTAEVAHEVYRMPDEKAEKRTARIPKPSMQRRSSTPAGDRTSRSCCPAES